MYIYIYMQRTSIYMFIVLMYVHNQCMNFVSEPEKKLLAISIYIYIDHHVSHHIFHYIYALYPFVYIRVYI